MAWLAAVGIAALALVAGSPDATQGRAPVRLAGTVTLQPVNVTQRCSFSRGANNTLVASCVQTGAFAGKPARAGAGYGWVWDLEVGANGVTTGNASERGELALNFGKLGVLRVTTSGRQAPVGTPTATQAQGRTTGTWKYKSGTRTFAKRRGSGTYTFDTARSGPDTFQTATIAIAGTLR